MSTSENATGRDLLTVDVLDDNDDDFFNDLGIQEIKKPDQNIFKALDVLSEEDDKFVEELLFKGKIPDKEFIKRVKMSGLGVSLSLIQLSKKLAGKLQIIESYLSKLEDKLFNDGNLEDMSNGEMLQLYQMTRILFEKTQTSLMQIQEKIDIDSVEMTLKALSTKADTEDNDEPTTYDDDNIDEIMDMIVAQKKKKAQERKV